MDTIIDRDDNKTNNLGWKLLTYSFISKTPGYTTFLILTGIALLISFISVPFLREFLHKANYETAAEYTKEQAVRIGKLMEQDLASGQTPEQLLQKFQYMLENSPQRASQFVCIVEGNNRVIAHPLRSNINKDVTGWIVQTEQGTVSYDYPARAGVALGGTQVRLDGSQDVVFHQPVKGVPWSVCVHVSYQELAKQTNAQLLAAATLLIPLVALLVILSSLASRTIAHTYEKKLIDANDQLSASRDELEERVSERTAQLAEVNRQLSIKVEEQDTQLENNMNFLANISHELRTPLNAVLGYSEAMCMEIFGPVDNPRYKEYLEHIGTSSGHLITILNDILDLSKLNASSRELEEEVVELRSVIDEAIAVVGPKAHNKNINLSCHGNDVSLFVDAGAMRQVLANLICNAVKYSDGDPEIKISWDMVGDEFHIRLSDQGIGISPEELETILLPFQQAATISRKERQGTGLGLPIASALVTLHGGQLKIESELGAGTTATIIFPASRVRQIPGQTFEHTGIGL